MGPLSSASGLRWYRLEKAWQRPPEPIIRLGARLLNDVFRSDGNRGALKTFLIERGFSAQSDSLIRDQIRQGVDNGQYMLLADARLPVARGVGGYSIERRLPADAVTVKRPNGEVLADPESSTKALMAPPRADFRAIFSAGRAIAGRWLPDQIPEIGAAVGQGGRFDFQRDVQARVFFTAYTNAGNYGVGVFMVGAGHSVEMTMFISETYAFFKSSNFDSQTQKRWIRNGAKDATHGDWR